MENYLDTLRDELVGIDAKLKEFEKGPNLYDPGGHHSVQRWSAACDADDDGRIAALCERRREILRSFACIRDIIICILSYDFS